MAANSEAPCRRLAGSRAPGFRFLFCSTALAPGIHPTGEFLFAAMGRSYKGGVLGFAATGRSCNGGQILWSQQGFFCRDSSIARAAGVIERPPLPVQLSSCGIWRPTASIASITWSNGIKWR